MPLPSSVRNFACTTWSTISEGLRLRWKPERAVKQKAHPMRQPAWVETQSVQWPAPGMRTLSTSRPSSRRKRIFFVVSSEVSVRTISRLPIRAFFAISARNSFERFVISSNDEAPCW